MSKTEGQPIPQGNYLPAVRNENIIYTSGMTPRKAGVLQFVGKIKADDAIEMHKEAVEIAISNALTAAEACLKDGEKIVAILQLNVYLNAEEQFTSHPKVADFASNLIVEKLGANSIGSRAAVGVASLPSNAPVEISIVAKVG